MTENFLPNLDFSGKRTFRHAPGVDDKKCPVIQSIEHVCLMLRKQVHLEKWLSLRNVFLCPFKFPKDSHAKKQRSSTTKGSFGKERTYPCLSLRVSVFPQRRKDFFNTFAARALLFCTIRTAMGKKGEEKKILEATRNEAMESNLPKERTDGGRALAPCSLSSSSHRERQSNPHTYRLSARPSSLSLWGPFG